MLGPINREDSMPVEDASMVARNTSSFWVGAISVGRSNADAARQLSILQQSPCEPAVYPGSSRLSHAMSQAHIILDRETVWADL